MKFVTAFSLLAAANAFTIQPQVGVSRAAVGVSSTSLASTTDSPPEKKKTKKEKRLGMFKSENFHRKGFKDVREDVESRMGEQFESDLVKDMKTNQFIVEKDGVKVHLAKVRFFLFCEHQIPSLLDICVYGFY